MRQYQHKSTSNFAYQKTGLSWPGPRNRALEALKKVTIPNQTEEFFLDFLFDNYRDIYDCIEWISFHSYSWKPPDDEKRYKIQQAVVYLKPSPKIRQLLFDEREKITLATSWYPTVTGSRAWINNRIWNSDQSLASIGTLVGIYPIENCDPIIMDGERRLSGTSFKVSGSTGNILLDCGYNCDTSNPNDFKFIFLSHYHKDHSAGFGEAVKKNSNIPIVTSRTSFTFLEMHPNVSQDTKQILRQNTILPDIVKKIDFSDGTSYQFFPVYHTPGSFGIKIIDRHGKHLTFLGDVCLRNGFHDVRDELAKKVCENKGKKNYVLLDCAMIGNKERIDIDDKPTSILQKISEDAIKRNIIVISNQVENTMYSYMLTFSISSKIEKLKQTKIIVSEHLYHLIRTLLEPFVFDKEEYKDPIAHKLIGESGMNFIETHRLYPLRADVLKEIPEDERCIFFVGEGDLKKEYLLRRIDKSDYIISGKMAVREDLPEVFLKLKPRTILRVSSEDWSFHSNENDLVEFIRKLSNEKITTLLFHKPFGSLLRFVESNKLDKRFVRIIGNRPHKLI